MNFSQLVRKASLILTLLVHFFSFDSAVSHALETNPTDDWTMDEKQMHDALKEVRPEASEAEIQEAMAYVFLNKNNQWEKAADHYKQAVQLNPKLFRSWYSLGLIFMGSEEGNEYFRKSTEANPNFAPSFYWLGYNAVRVGHDKDAIIYFQKYLQVAKGTEETDRITTVQEILKELKSGKLGDEVEKLRGKD